MAFPALVFPTMAFPALVFPTMAFPALVFPASQEAGWPRRGRGGVG